VPTSDQIRIFQSLPAEQREAAIEAIRQGGDLRVEPRAGQGPFGLAGTPEEEAAAAGAGEAAAGDTREMGMRPTDFGLPPPRVRAGDVLVVATRPPPEPPLEGELPEVVPWREARYTVDRDGRLWVSGETPLAVLGWTVDQVADALSSLPFGQGKEVQVRLVPRADLLTGLGLEPFGYDLFAHRAQAYRPDPNAPVAKDYVVGPGDTFLIQLFGKESAQYELGVTRDGTLLIPKFGPLQVAGLPFEEARRTITDRVKAQAIGVDVSVTMGALRTIQVFVLGDVTQPGMQVLSAFATPLHALLAARGVLPNGSLRNVEVKRGGATVNRIDLYDVLLDGDTGGYDRLQPGDVVFVPPVSGLVSVGGLVRRPAIYEVQGGETVADLLALAGGVSAEGDPGAVRMRRSDPEGGQRILDLEPAAFTTPVADGDLIQVFPRVGPVTRSVTVRGHVAAPGVYAWSEGQRLLDLFPSPVGVLPDTDPAFILILRQENGMPAYLQESLVAALADPAGPHNRPLADGDELFVFSRDADRAALLQPQVAELARLAVAGRVPDRAVEVRGEVHFPGRYPLTRGMRLTDLVTAAGEVNEKAYPYEVEITRFTVVPHGERRETEHLLVDLSLAREGDAEHDVPLRPDDRVNVRAVPEWQGESVTLSGELRFPGVYVIESGETVTSLIARAGGLTEDAFLPGAVFQREEVRVQEQAELDRLARTFEQDLVRVATEPATFGSGDRGQALSAGRELLRLVRQTKATGRMSLTLARDKGGGVSVQETTLRLVDGDHLHIPRRPDSVLVLGEVYHPTAHLFRKGKSVRDYVNLSGGITKRGSRGDVLVIHANGSVTTVKVGRVSSGGRIALGDTVVVPQRIVTFSSLKLATDVTQILYQLAITAASAKAIGVF
jgi:protein involved in polysaccharide export with SLBB domain